MPANRILLILVAFLICSCGKKSTADDQRKATFLRILKYCEKEQLDSIKKYLITPDNVTNPNKHNQEVMFDMDYKSAQYILKNCNLRLVISDSIQLRDSLALTYGVFKYDLNFYDHKNIIIGNIQMMFVKNDYDHIYNFFSWDNAPDTTGNPLVMPE